MNRVMVIGRFAFFFIVGFVFLMISCKEDEKPQTSRSFRMGFQSSAPRFDDFDLFIQTLKIWETRADAAIISTEVPWDSLLAGKNAVAYVVNNYKGLVDYYRSKNLMLWVYIDPQNGLDRTSDAVPLMVVGKSIAQADMQEKYRRFVIVMDSILKPEHLGLALETNLIRAASSTAVYGGVKKAVNDVAKELKLRNTKAKLSVSIQVDYAWGKLSAGGKYEGIAKDFEDFPFMEEMGFSSYPYFGFDKASDIPQNYYSRLIEGKKIPVFVAEGGWSSKSVTTPDRTFISSDQIQKEYIERHEQLLNSVQATALFQLAFADFDVSSLPPNVPPNLGYFVNLGLVDINLQAKPSLEAWDKIFKKPLK